jgi:hypothetical protein
LAQPTKMGKYVPNYHNIYQKTIIGTHQIVFKIPNDQKYTKVLNSKEFKSIQQLGFFVMPIYHLATLVGQGAASRYFFCPILDISKSRKKHVRQNPFAVASSFTFCFFMRKTGRTSNT